MSPASNPSRVPMAFSTRTPSTSSTSFPRGCRWAACRSSSVALPGGGFIQMRSSGTPPSGSIRSASFGGASLSISRVVIVLASLAICLLFLPLLAGERHPQSDDTRQQQRSDQPEDEDFLSSQVEIKNE